MINRLMEKRNRQEGFTLIEMLIVVIILGILAAVVVFAVGTFRDDSVAEACKTDIKNVETAATAYVAKNNLPAASMAALSPDFLRDVPGNGPDYHITYTASGSDFTVTGNLGTSTSPGAAC